MRIEFNLKKNRLIYGAGLAVGCVSVCSLSGATTYGFIFMAAFLLISSLELKCSSKISKAINIIWCAFSAVLAVVLSQVLLNVGISKVPPAKLMWAVIIVGFIISVLFLITMNYRATVFISTLATLVLATVNYFVFWFRGSEFAPYDILAISTAFNVADKYTFKLTTPMLYAWMIGIFYCFLGFSVPKSTVERSIKKSFAILFIAVCLFGSFCFGTSNIKAKHFGQMGSYYNGYLLNFSLQFRNLTVKKPLAYSLDVIKEQEANYMMTNTSACQDVDVIVIMSEALGDLSVFRESIDPDVMPFVQSLSENVIKGHALVSGIGGGTSNSEYEFLTSNSLGLLPTGCFPFQQFIEKGSYSIVASFENMGYSSLGTHPASGENWMRTTVYPNISFDEYYFVEDYSEENPLRGMVSDEKMFDQLVEWYERDDTGKNRFIFGVTMQNHSPYNFENITFTRPVELNGLTKEYPDVEQYLSLLNESDIAFEKMITYFESVDKNVVILVFGDHMPQLSTAFYEELHGGPFETLEEQMLQYTVPFFIWANYDIEEQDVGLTSLNFLSNYLYEAAGLPLPAYNAFLRDVQEVIPAMNVFGYYSKEKEAFVPYDEAAGIEAEMLNLYRILQYNCLFDKDNRSLIFFPIPS